MKISNTDLIQLTEIKQYFFEPPLTYKLPVYACEHIVKAITILRKYPFVKKEDIAFLETIGKQMEEKSLRANDIKEKLREAGKRIASLSNK